MKKIIIPLIVFQIAMTSFVQTPKKKNGATSNDNTQKEQNFETAIYQLFPTQNIWVFIKLNTRNGQMWQVQYDVEGIYRFVTNLNSESLVNKDKEANGRFTLYSTQNMWTFILLDQIDGRTWQVQWSMDAKERLIIPIE